MAKSEDSDKQDATTQAEAKHARRGTSPEPYNHDLLRAKASLRSQHNPPSPAGTVATTTSSSRSFTPRASSHRLVEAKASLSMNRSVDSGERTSDILRCSLESLVDDHNDDRPIIEIENAPTLVRDLEEFRNSQATLTSHPDDMTRESRTFDVVEWVDGNGASAQEVLQLGDEQWDDPESSLAASHLLGPGADEDRFDERSLEVVTAVMVDEEEERSRIELESRQAVAGDVVQAEFVDVRKRRAVMKSVLLAVAAVIVALVTVLVAIKSGHSSATSTSDILLQPSEWIKIANAASLSGSTASLTYPPSEQASTGEKALAWLIEESDGVTERRATQRFAFMVLAFSWNNPEWNIPSDFDECDLKGVTCDADSSCIEMDLTSAGLAGTIPAEIALLTDMRKVSLADGDLTGPVPWELILHRWDKMEYINLNFNELSGPLPSPEPGTWPLIEQFWVAWNQFTGTISPDYVHWPVLQDFLVKDNRLTGTIPSELGAISTMIWFAVSENDLRGTLPTEIAQWTNIQYFELDKNNGLSGTIPTESGQWSLIRDTQPIQISNWSRLEKFHADFNSFSGTLPLGMSSWTKLTSLHINNNDFTGPLPAGIGNWASLKEIQLNDNRLSGALSSGVNSWSNLKYGSFQANRFSGSVDGLCDTSGAGVVLSADCCEVDCACCTSCFVDGGTVDANCALPASMVP